MSDAGTTVTLFTDSLLSKWGFWDGDILDDVLHDRADNEGCGYPRGDIHAVLIRAVREYMLLEQTVKLVEIVTNHNPIRADLVDGVEINWYENEHDDPPTVLTPESVEVPVDVLYEWWKETWSK